MPKTRFLLRTFFFSKTKICVRQKIQKWKICLRQKRLTADFSFGNTGGWGGRIKHNENDWKFQRYKETNLGYNMLCGSVNSDQEEKEQYLLNSNRIINLNNLITNIDKMLVCN